MVEKDIEKILENKKISDKNFFILILHFLLENESIDLTKVEELSNELENHYKEFLNSFEMELVESNGEIINVLREAIRKFSKRIRPILDKVKQLKK
ncbi:MAG: hypothetical protein KAJ30_07985 [Candidatus Heimdallarchaeota archaeon]|nr:hypothetical protein [Candidatus Heimdallarchaeota archaeon]